LSGKSKKTRANGGKLRTLKKDGRESEGATNNPGSDRQRENVRRKEKKKACDPLKSKKRGGQKGRGREEKRFETRKVPLGGGNGNRPSKKEGQKGTGRGKIIFTSENPCAWFGRGKKSSSTSRREKACEKNLHAQKKKKVLKMVDPPQKKTPKGETKREKAMIATIR